jgi:hypothetical protein
MTQLAWNLREGDTDPSFTPECLPPQLSRCFNDAEEDCTAWTVNLATMAAACGPNVLKLKYGPDKILKDRRDVYKDIYTVTVLNLLIFVVPNTLVLYACLIFGAKSEPDGMRPKLFGVVTGKWASRLSKLVAFPCILVCVILALFTASCSLARFWKEVHEFHSLLTFDRHCNFLLMLEFIGYKDCFVIMAFAAFTLVDMILVLSIAIWSIMLWFGAAFSSVWYYLTYVCCCCGCVCSKYLSCQCFWCMYLFSICFCCASVSFIVCLFPLALYFFLVVVAAIFVYGLLMFIILKIIMLIQLALRFLLAAACCGKMIAWPTADEMKIELGILTIVQGSRSFLVFPLQEVSGAPHPEYHEPDGCYNTLTRYVAFSFIVPFILTQLCSLLYPTADSSLLYYALSYADMTWWYDRFQDTSLPWRLLFQHQWVYMAQGITEFAKTMFWTWPQDTFTQLKELFSTGTDEAIKTVDGDWDLTQMWTSDDINVYMRQIILCRLLMAALEGVISTGIAINHSLLAGREDMASLVPRDDYWDDQEEEDMGPGDFFEGSAISYPEESYARDY